MHNLGYTGLVQATDGNFYGTTYDGGANGWGTIFKITPGGKLTTLYSFCAQSNCTDGGAPLAGLVQATDGNFYGTTSDGGANLYYGTIFKITPSGTLTTLYSFCSQSGCADGEIPYAGLIQATGGNPYGTTEAGGADRSGTIFKITPGGTLTTLYSFCSQSGCTDGSLPYAGLIQAIDGNLYGTTSEGGANNTNSGTVFKITPSGTLTTLYSFCAETNCTDGANPQAGLVQATDGNFYGTTYLGGANPTNCFYGCGTVFKITPTGTLTTLYSFCSRSGCTDGSYPEALIEATDGNLYGTTPAGGNGTCTNYVVGGCGTVFKITPGGKLTTVYSFCSQSGCTDGEVPLAGLVQATDGNFYGTTNAGGANSSCNGGYGYGCGTVFSLSVGLGPFVEPQTTSGKVGTDVRILGTNLTGTTSVTFNGTAAFFKVKSSSEIGAVVPPGATTGTVQVVTSGGTLTSNVPFRVRP